ncbi:MAG: type II toxin-antitoxin system prevent-host-death family antitoxin [Planctomycetes bacterium]|nr:type II toxin-antitoxin system prevent-host-death family antitoxin [Planctomycetota bacterium]
MREVTVHEARTHLSRLLVHASLGEEIVIVQGGKPIARIIPFAAAKACLSPAHDEGMVECFADREHADPELDSWRCFPAG